MDEEARQRQEMTMELTRREMSRKSRDVIRVYNPLNETFKFMWDGYVQSVPAKSEKDMERYLANHYFMKISQRIINDMIAEVTQNLTDKKKATGNSWVDKYSENRELMTQVPSLTDPELLKKIHNDVILGLVEEYGMELPEEEPVQKTADTRDVYEQIMSNDRRVEDRLDPKPIMKPIEEPKIEPKAPVKTIKKPIKPKAEEITND